MTSVYNCLVTSRIFTLVHVDYRTHSNKGRILCKVGTPHNIENDLFNIYFSNFFPNTFNWVGSHGNTFIGL